MMQPIKHTQYTKAICDVAGILFGLVNNEPQPDSRRGVLERMRAAIEEALAEPEPEQPPKMPDRSVDFYVQSSNGEDTWIHHPDRFETEAQASLWALTGYHRWHRVQRVETSYKLVELVERPNVAIDTEAEEE
jgi:hypothetical protein